MEEQLIIHTEHLNRDEDGYLYYENKLFTGVEEWHYDTGEVGTTTEYLNGVPHGWMTGLFKNGKIRSKKRYQNGCIHGTVEKWDEHGAKLYEAEIYNGKAIMEKEWDDQGRLTKKIIKEKV